MSFLKRLFSKPAPPKPTGSGPILKVDLHNHILPGIDDGVDDWDEAIAVVKGLKELGYEKLYATPHVMGDFFRNSPDTILPKRDELRQRLKDEGIDIQIEAAAEYYLDGHYMERLKAKELLTIGNNYVLVETSYIEPTQQFNDFIFQTQAQGYKPILAHPERYLFMHPQWSNYEDLMDKGVFFQINLSSLTGYYSPVVRTVAERLLKEGKVHFFGTDLHHVRHLKPVRQGLESTAYRMVEDKQVLNASLL